MTFIDFVEWLGEAPVSMLMGAAASPDGPAPITIARMKPPQ